MSFVRKRSITVRFDIFKGADVSQKGEKKKDVAAIIRIDTLIPQMELKIVAAMKFMIQKNMIVVKTK